MGAYAGANNYPNTVYQFDETDVVQGGPDGIDNRPLKDLADRTAWLREQLGIFTRYNGLTETTPGAINNTMAGKLVIAYSAGVVNINLESPATFKHGDFVDIASHCDAGCVVNLFSPSFPIYDPLDMRAIYMHNKEKIRLVAYTNHWRIAAAAGNFYCAGEEIKARKVIGNTLPLQGQLLDRSRYPRLWEYVQGMTFGQEVVNESTYFSDPFIYRGCFTIGNGSTTFRLPDERGMSDRMMDGGRGVDLSRLHNFPGGYAADQLKSHGHTYRDRYFAENNASLPGSTNKESIGFISFGSRETDGDNNMFLYVDKETGSTGGTENTVKNIGKLNLIKF